MRKRPSALFLLTATLLAGNAGAAGTVEGHVSYNRPAPDFSNFVITVEDVEGPSSAPQKTAVMDQQGLRFVPHVLAIQVGTTVEFPNSDPVSHNIFSISEAKRFNLGLYGRGTVRRIRFDRPGVVALLCNVHMEMAAYIVIVRNPYFAQPGADGTYRISGIPAGKHLLRCWHERLPPRSRVVQVPETGTVRVDFTMG